MTQNRKFPKIYHVHSVHKSEKYFDLLLWDLPSLKIVPIPEVPKKKKQYYYAT